MTCALHKYFVFFISKFGGESSQTNYVSSQCKLVFSNYSADLTAKLKNPIRFQLFYAVQFQY